MKSEHAKEVSKDGGCVLTRRKAVEGGLLVSTLAATSSIPGKWVRPVVESAVLPAHAMTSVQPVARCSVSWSVDSLNELLEGDNDFIPAVDVTVTNIGDVPLTPVGGDGFFTLSIEPDVMVVGINPNIIIPPISIAPNDSFTISIASIEIDVCEESVATAAFTFEETGCSASVSVFCAEPAG